MPLDRQLVSEFAIAGGACAVLLFGVLTPAEKKLAQARAAQATLRSEAQRATDAQTMIAAHQSAIVAAESRIDALRDAGLLVGDEGGLYAWVESLAGDWGVDLDQISPEDAANAASVRNENNPAERRAGDDEIALTLFARGEFSAITSFVHALETATPLTRVTMLEIMPDHRGGTLVAQIRTRHAMLDLSPLTQLERDWLALQEQNGVTP